MWITLGRYAISDTLKIGSLCTGYGGLDMAVEAYFNAKTVWVSEIDKYACKVIDARINKPNIGNLKIVNWAEVEPVDIITAGYPCQPFSQAGLRKGAQDERHLWPYIKRPLAHYDQNTSSWKTYEDTLDLGLEKSSATLPLSGMTQDGLLYELVRSVPHTGESDYLSLPTPIAHDGHEPSPATFKRNSPGIAAVILMNIPTPTASDAIWDKTTATRSNIKGNHNLSLADWSKQLLPTPTAIHVRNHDEPVEKYEQRVLDYEEGRTKGKPGASLGLALRWTKKQYRLHWTKVN
jgi:hypothetical protein